MRNTELNLVKSAILIKNNRIHPSYSSVWCHQSTHLLSLSFKSSMIQITLRRTRNTGKWRNQSSKNLLVSKLSKKIYLRHHQRCLLFTSSLMILSWKLNLVNTLMTNMFASKTSIQSKLCLKQVLWVSNFKTSNNSKYFLCKAIWTNSNRLVQMLNPS